MRGIVKSWRLDLGYGFVICEDLLEVFGPGTEVFLHHKEMQPGEEAVVGPRTTISFHLKLGADGRPQARDVKVESRPQPFVRRPPAVTQQEPETYLGAIKSFSRETGFGFISCPETEARFKRDVFLHKNHINGLEVGDTVRFQIEVDQKGQPKARNVEATAETLAARTEKVEVTKPADWLSGNLAGEKVASASGSQPPEVGRTSTPEEVVTFPGAVAPARGVRQPPPPPPEEPAGQGAMVEGMGLPGLRWKQYLTDDGVSKWFWNEEDDDWFMETQPGAWQRFEDPFTGKEYWWNNDNQKWFWTHQAV